MSMLRLDAPTLGFSVAMLATILSIVSYTLSRGTTREDFGLRDWAKSMAFAAGATFFWSFAGYWPFFLTFVVANVFGILALPFAITAHARLFNVRPPMHLFAITIVVGLSGVVGTFFWGTWRGIAIITTSTSVAVQLAAMAYMVQSNRHPQTKSIALISVLAAAGFALIHAGRSVQVAFGDIASVIPTGYSITQISYYFYFTAYIAASSIAFFAMTNDRNRRETFERLRRDGLTGLYTRTAFFEMEGEIEKLGKSEGYALLMVDIDHFKAVNDRYGHTGGDTVLAHVGRLILNSFRLSDIPVRYGGEEFCILLRGCEEVTASQFAQRLVQEASKHPVRLANGSSVEFTLSVGFACRSSNHRETLLQVLERADSALYDAKRCGRNQAKAANFVNVFVPT